MRSISILLRSLLVFLGLAVLFVPITFLKPDATTHTLTENLATLQEPEIEALSGLEIPNDITDANAIFEIKTYAYLADEGARSGAERSVRPANDTANRLIVAKDLSQQKQFTKALIILQNAEPAAQNTYDVQFLRARILSWASYHIEAEQLFRGLMQEYPSDADITVAYAYLKLYREQIYEAEKLFAQVIAQYPHYSEARTGLERSRALIGAQ